jgi:DNA-binding response OmpR family regulator
MRVLIIEDEPDVADFLARALREAAWAPDVAATGDSALQSLSANDYDLAVLDLGLPDIDGSKSAAVGERRAGAPPS